MKYGDSCLSADLLSHFCTVHLPTTTHWTRISLAVGLAPAEVTRAMPGGRKSQTERRRLLDE